LSVEWSGYEGFHRGFSLGAGAKSEALKAAQSGLDVKSRGVSIIAVFTTMAMSPAMRAAANLRELLISSCFVGYSPEKFCQVVLSIWAIPAKIAAAGAKSLASVAAPLHPPGFLELRPNNTCMLLFCSAALQLRRADSSGSAMRILEEQAWNGAKNTIF